MRLMRCLGLALLMAALPATAQAYVGPGLGLGAIGVVLAVLLSGFLAVMALIWYPIKRLFRGRKKAERASAPAGLSREANE